MKYINIYNHFILGIFFGVFLTSFFIYRDCENKKESKLGFGYNITCEVKK